MNIADIAKAIAGIDADPALCGALKAQLATSAPNFVKLFSSHNRLREERPFPNPATVTAAQMSLFDNWIEYGGRRPARGTDDHYRDRFKVTFDLWTTPAERLNLKTDAPCFSGVAHLWSGKDIAKRAKGKSSMKLPKILNSNFRQFVIQTASNFNANGRLGMVYTPLGKTIAYHDGLYVPADASEFAAHDVSSVIVATEAGDIFEFKGFSKTTSKGGRYAINCFGHSRMTVVPKLAKTWNATLMEAPE
ncbi:hypothetical protein AV944_06600 [Sphingomonas sp. LK11]|uniref:hypothetical protein n=1 Tax=Sphingomonas sp. LK11 TaxID=1390395 RepID=UPI0009726F14|nr:hypothetical protein [Sphingomonas sp. LK11]APX65566.1 hypothetical protein AV944_06600 [Sphingomonas sp. LK11]